MSASTTQAIPVVHTLSIGKLFLPESQQFNGKNLEDFKENFGLLLSTVDLEYLIDSTITAPTSSILDKDNSNLFRILYANVNAEARVIVSEKRSEGGKVAWEHLQGFYGKKDVGTTIARFKEYMALTWPGGDVDSFQTFLTKKSMLRAELTTRKYKITDDAYAAHIIASVPISHLPLNGSIDLTDLSKLKSDDLITGITSNIAILNMSNNSTALYANKEQNKEHKRPYLACGYCKSKGFTKGRINHKEEECRR